MFKVSLTRGVVVVALFAWATGVATSARAQSEVDAPHGPVATTLWVGNSFFYSNNSMHSHVAALARAADPGSRYRAVSATISGAALGWHDIAAYMRPDGIGSLVFNALNEVVQADPAPRIDKVIMMDCSQCPIHPQLQAGFYASVEKQSRIVVAHGAQPILFMSWAYKDRPEMTALLAEQYARAGKAHHAAVIPAGLAFARAIAMRPEVDLYQTDLRHPNIRGTYLAACTVYAATTQQSPVGSRYTAGIDPATVAFLQTVAWQTVQDYSANNAP